jgi:hypothetical protein
MTYALSVRALEAEAAETPEELNPAHPEAGSPGPLDRL